MHRFLAEIEWLDMSAAQSNDARSALPSDTRLRELARALEHDERRIEAALAEFHAALALPAMRALVTRPTTNDELVVWRERRFALHLPNENGVEELWQGAFDRVVLVKQQGRVVRADLIDWKSDHVAPDDVLPRAAEYRPQLEAYQKVLARIADVDAQSITARIAFLHAGVVVELAPQPAV